MAFSSNKTASAILLGLICLASCAPKPSGQPAYEGVYCRGEGDTTYLRLIDESFAFFDPNPIVPNLAMLYKPEWDTFVEGAGWNAWWIQNSYGFSYAATPFLQEPWFSILQRSWDLHWDNQGDGKRMSMWDGSPTGAWFSGLIAPDGSLGDMARPHEIGFKQGDGDQNVHDWFYEAAAAGLVMQSEILLANRDTAAMRHYLPKMERACAFIECTRDPKNNLFLVGPASNLLAPSYGGVRKLDGSLGKGYLAGLSITYLAALDRMAELYLITGEKDKLELCKKRQEITRSSLPLLLTTEGYFVKSIEPGGIRHGVLGQEPHNYLEGVANADAVALRVVDHRTAESIYTRIASYPAIRPFDFLLTNAPSLDDTYWEGKGAFPGAGTEVFRQFGHWVDGGAWGTVEGRAILMYSRLGRFDDILRSGVRAMKWAKDFRMDAPWSQQGENTDNLWSDSGEHHVGGVSVMIDNFAIPAATVRGLFDYEYRSDRLILRPRVPGSITYYEQKQSVRFGEKRLFLSCRNGGPRVKAVKVNGRPQEGTTPDEVVLLFATLPDEARIEIVTEGGSPAVSADVVYPRVPALDAARRSASGGSDSLGARLRKPYAVLSRFRALIAKEPGADYERAFVGAALRAFESCAMRASLDPGPGYYRVVTAERKATMQKFYENAALGMYDGLDRRMSAAAGVKDAQGWRIRKLFKQARR
ncbi:MAG: hypothetical protein IPI01_17830 [Ignavibacteriae bacterium]|nr:hypothetical protein [Ignavibacteriota bacterium]